MDLRLTIHAYALALSSSIHLYAVGCIHVYVNVSSSLSFNIFNKHATKNLYQLGGVSTCFSRVMSSTQVANGRGTSGFNSCVCLIVFMKSPSQSVIFIQKRSFMFKSAPVFNLKKNYKRYDISVYLGATRHNEIKLVR